MLYEVILFLENFVDITLDGVCGKVAYVGGERRFVGQRALLSAAAPVSSIPTTATCNMNMFLVVGTREGTT